MTKVLFVNSSARQCGIYEIGKATSDTLAKSQKFELQLAELPVTTSTHEFFELLRQSRPDVVLYNYHPTTTPWVTSELLSAIRHELPRIKLLGVAHENPPQFPQLHAIIQLNPLCADNYGEFAVPRPVPRFTLNTAAPQNVIGSFGTGETYKGFARVVDQVNCEFDDATVRINMPFSSSTDPDGKIAKEIAQQCRDRANPGIKVEITHDDLSRLETVEWLSRNSINCFFSSRMDGAGPAGELDLALAAQRPIALSDSYMYRHVTEKVPESLITDRTIREIIAAGFAPLQKLVEEWSDGNLLARYEAIVEEVQRPGRIELCGNRALTTDEIPAMAPVIEELNARCPDHMNVVDAETEFENAFLFAQAKRAAQPTHRILVLGNRALPVAMALQNRGHHVELQGADRSLQTIFTDAVRTNQRFDLVIGRRVLRDQTSDATVIQQIYQILKPGGNAFLTADFLDLERGNFPPPGLRPLAAIHLRELLTHLPPGSLLAPLDWQACEPGAVGRYVAHGGCSITFRKSEKASPSEATAAAVYSAALNETMDRYAQANALQLQAAAELGQTQNQLAAATSQLASVASQLTQESQQLAQLRSQLNQTTEQLHVALNFGALPIRVLVKRALAYRYPNLALRAKGPLRAARDRMLAFVAFVQSGRRKVPSTSPHGISQS